MDVYRPLRGGIFLFELGRLLLILWMMTALVIPLRADGEIGFPYLGYGVPNALFLLMAFFLLLRPGEYRPYIHLYMAGKIIAIAANLGWLLFSLRDIPLAAAMDTERTQLILGFVFLLVALDGLSILGVSLLNTRLKRAALKAGGETVVQDSKGGAA
jgi:hypothetical protein